MGNKGANEEELHEHNRTNFSCTQRLLGQGYERTETEGKTVNKSQI